MRIVLGTVFVTIICAQQVSPPAEPRFEVVSIRQAPPSKDGYMRSWDFTPFLPGGRYIDPHTNLPEMIGIAYHVTNYAKLVGLPGWTEHQSFAVSAKPAEGFPVLSPAANREQIGVMVRAMLADRFHLQMHTETRRERLYKLEVSKGGLRIKAVDAPVPPATEQPVFLTMGDSSGRLIGKKSTMAGMAAALQTLLRMAVVDDTGIKGHFDFDVKWSSPEPAGAPGTAGSGGQAVGLLISALQNDFGLRLATATGPVEYWVVDHVELPTEN